MTNFDISWNSREVNCFPWSDTMNFGAPNFRMTSSKNILLTRSAVISRVGLITRYLVNESVIATMYLLPPFLDSGQGPHMSILVLLQGESAG